MVFSDEKMFRFRPGYSVGVWRPKGADRYSAKYTVKTTQRGEGLMVWAAINLKGEYIVRRCPKKMKADDYQELLADCLPFLKGRCCCFVSSVWRLAVLLFPRRAASRVEYQQDGAPVHKAKSTERWLRLKGVKQFNGGVWPAQSPDLNIIEHVWPRVAKVMQGQVFRNADDLWHAIEAAFATLTPDFVQSLYASIPRRLFACLGAKGGHTKY